MQAENLVTYLERHLRKKKKQNAEYQNQLAIDHFAKICIVSIVNFLRTKIPINQLS